MEIAIGATAVVLLSILWFAVASRRLLTARRMADENWKPLEQELAKRSELVSRLAALVTPRDEGEATILKGITFSLKKIAIAESPAEKAHAENNLSFSVKYLFTFADGTPDLKENKEFVDLQAKLMEIEDNIQRTRKEYNESARTYNNMLYFFPGTLVAKIYKLTRLEYFELHYATKQDVFLEKIKDNPNQETPF